MISNKEDVLRIIHDREDRLEALLKKDPSKFSISKLKKVWNQWNGEVKEARKLTKEYDPKLPKEDFGFVYTLMNEYSAFRSHSVVASIYIKKLENNLSIS